jgi:hypothetical protein
MNIEYDVNINDIVEFNLFNLKHHPQLKKRLQILRIAYFILSVALVAIGLVMISKSGNSTGILFLVFGVGLFVYYLYQFSGSRVRKRITKAVRNQYKKIPNEEICRHNLTISDAGIHVVTDYHDSTTQWSAITEIVRTEYYIYLFLLPGKAWIIPYRALGSDEKFNRFAETARNYQAKAVQ